MQSLGHLLVNIGTRDFVDYRPDSSIDPQVLKDNNIFNINFDSLHFFPSSKFS